jgi:hypothetical protein
MVGPLNMRRKFWVESSSATIRKGLAAPFVCAGMLAKCKHCKLFFNNIQVTCVGARVMGFAKTRATMP